MRWDEQKLRIFDVDAEQSSVESKKEKRTASIFRQAFLMGVADGEESLVGDSETQLEQDIAQYLAETYGQAFEFERIDPRQSRAGARILDSDPQHQRRYVRAIVELMLEKPGDHMGQLQSLLTAMLRRSGAWDESTLCDWVAGLAGYQGRYLWPLPTASVLRTVERYLAAHELSQPLKRALDDLRRLYKVRATTGEDRKLYQRMNQLLQSAEPPEALIEFCTGEAWAMALAGAINSESAAQRAAWRALLDHAGTAKSPAPRPAWLKQAAVLVDAVGNETFCRAIKRCLEVIGQNGDATMFRAQFEHRSDASQIHEQYADLLRGLVWCAGTTRIPELVPFLGRAAELCFERLPGKQPRSLKVAAACIQSLVQFRDRQALSELMRLATRARQASVKQKLASAVKEVLQSVELSPCELDELSVPDLELADLGQYRCCIGKHCAVITIESPGVTRLTWHSEDRPPQHVIPAAIKSFHSDDWARVRKRHREIAAELPPLKLRLERLFVARVAWDFARFRRHYLDQPLVGPFVRSLIWTITVAGQQESAIWHDGQLRDHSNRPITGISDHSLVRPWHPLSSDPVDVLAWQAYIEQQGICQPFKQAHREIYAPLADESGEAMVSERFEGHVVEPYRLHEIATVRGWQLHTDEGPCAIHTPYWELPQWNLRASWSTLPLIKYSLDVDLHRNTQGVSFQTLDSGEPVALKDVPSIVYSEAMREIECYLLQYGAVENFAVNFFHCSSKRMRDYWQQAAFGPLTVQGQVRKALLERLLPKSKLANSSEIRGEFLLVQGKRNHYRIHLSSGNVQIGPRHKLLHPVGYAFSPEHTGLPPGDCFPRLPFGGDIRLACILRQASRLP